ncbi:5-oxoprolinase subunit B family protein [Pelagibacterium sp.]|uniref:5-oxoprolinase subunit B family protein n=1 Tax=Pelagibacterium sp. TaxID=1967288 RepID=UPI003A8CAAF3
MQVDPATPLTAVGKKGYPLESAGEIIPTLMPLGDSGILLRFADRLDLNANAAAIDYARRLQSRPIPGVIEIVPNLASVLVRYDPRRIGYAVLSGELRLIDSNTPDGAQINSHEINVAYGGEDGPDIVAVAGELGMTVPTFIAAHQARLLKILAVGFAPGFFYCGMHGADLHVPRRADVRLSVPAGSILFAARQTAVTATPVPTGWAVIGRTQFKNFDPSTNPPTRIRAGDIINFTGAP